MQPLLRVPFNASRQWGEYEAAEVNHEDVMLAKWMYETGLDKNVFALGDCRFHDVRRSSTASPARCCLRRVHHLEYHENVELRRRFNDSLEVGAEFYSQVRSLRRQPGFRGGVVSKGKEFSRRSLLSERGRKGDRIVLARVLRPAHKGLRRRFVHFLRRGGSVWMVGNTTSPLIVHKLDQRLSGLFGELRWVIFDGPTPPSTCERL